MDWSTHSTLYRSTAKDYRDNPLLLLTTMKFSLALVLVSLSVLTAAKHEFVRKANGNHNPSQPCPPPLVPGKGNECVPANPEPKHEFVRKANGNHDPSQPCPPPLVPGKDGECVPANPQPEHEFVRKANGNHNPSPSCPPPLVPGKGNECVPADSQPKHEFVRKANGKSNPNQPGRNGASSTVAPANSQPKETGTGSTSGTSSSGWVQNPSGKASFTARSGCSSPGKSCVHSHVTSWNSLSATSCPQRAARK